MVPEENLVANHYTHGSLLDAIATGLEKLGRSPETTGVDDLAPVDEFHIGGRAATEQFLDQLGIVSGDHVLDVGCGLGGASRFSAQRYGCRVTGIDLTREYVETGAILNSWVGLGDRIHLEQANASAIPYPEATFDRAYMLHVGMNIADKRALASELHRVLKPGGTLGIYDVMRVGDGDLEFPVPWADSPEGSSVSRPDEYKQALDEVGFRAMMERDRAGFAQQFFAELQARAATAAGPPALGLHILMGETAPTKFGNMVENISRGRVAPVELIAEKPATRT
jgi:ubiquinone/menaquinone biosynthesis C-methylase UbiE